jgi:hypothetical protein
MNYPSESNNMKTEFFTHTIPSQPHLTSFADLVPAVTNRSTKDKCPTSFWGLSPGADKFSYCITSF